MEAMSLTEILAFDDSGLAGELFGPLNAHLELVADASGAEFSTRGTELAVTSSDPRCAERICCRDMRLCGAIPMPI